MSTFLGWADAWGNSWGSADPNAMRGNASFSFSASMQVNSGEMQGEASFSISASLQLVERGAGTNKRKKFQVETKRGIIEVDTLEQAQTVIRQAKASAKQAVTVSLQGVKVSVPSKPNIDYKAIEARLRAEIEAELDDEEILLLL